MCYTKIPKNTGILFSKIPVSVFEFNPGIPVFSGIPQGPAASVLYDTAYVDLWIKYIIKEENAG